MAMIKKYIWINAPGSIGATCFFFDKTNSKWIYENNRRKESVTIRMLLRSSSNKRNVFYKQEAPMGQG